MGSFRKPWATRRRESSTSSAGALRTWAKGPRQGVSLRRRMSLIRRNHHRRQREQERARCTTARGRTHQRDGFLGTGCGDKFEALRGDSGRSEEEVQRAEEPVGLQAKRADKRLLLHLVAEARFFHGKEGVNGSSPLEGFTKGQQMAFLLPEQRTPIARSSLNLSPRSVPISRALEVGSKKGV